MRMEFIKSLIDRGFSECIYCGKIIAIDNCIKGSCPDCAQRKYK